MKQGAFDLTPRLEPVCGPLSHQVSREAKPRLSAQCGAILARLRQGNATNWQLADMALKYTSRISDLRRAGYDIRVVESDKKLGRVVYRLEGEG